eukprot:jgi/Chlat1/2674/Chrsp18S02980
MGVRLWPSSSRTTGISAAEGLESVVDGGGDHQRQEKRSSLRIVVATALPLLLFTLLASLRKRCSRLLAASRRRKAATPQLSDQSTEQPIVAEGGPARKGVVMLKMADVIDLCSDAEDPAVLRSSPSAPQHGKTKLRLPTARVADTRVARASSSSWACLACTFQNDTQYILCQICDAEREWGDTPAPAITSSRAAVSWACKECTLVNDATNARCEVCTLPRPQQTGVATTSTMRRDVKPATFPMSHPLKGSDKSSDKLCTTALTCQLCGSKQSASELYALDRCSHRACRACLQRRVHRQVAERLSNAQQPQEPRDTILPTCSVSDCGQPLSERDSRMLLKPQELADLNAFTRKALERLWARKTTHTCASCGKKGTAVHPERADGAASSKRRKKLSAAEAEGDKTHAELLATVTFELAHVVAGVTPAMAAGPQPIPVYKRSHLDAMRVCDLRALAASKGLDSNRVKAELVKDLLTAPSRSSGDAPAASTADAEPQGHQLSVPPPWLVCTACAALQCKACGDRIPNASHCADHLLACEQRGPYVALQVVTTIEAAMRAGNGVPSPRASVKRATQSARGTNRGGSSKWARGTGYGGNHYEAVDEASLDGARWRQQTSDSQLQAAAAALTQVLSEASCDDGVAGTASPSRLLCVAMQAGGHVAGMLRSLLANDSMLDVGDRRSLYLQMLALLRAIGSHAELLPILCERQRADDANAGGRGEGEKEDEDEGPASVVDVLKGLHVQSQVFLKAQGSHDLEMDEVGIAAMGVALDVRTSFEQVKASVDVWKASTTQALQSDGAVEVTDGPKPKAVVNAAAREKVYMDEIRELQFDMVSLLEKGHYAHYFRQEIEASESRASSGNGAGRALRVMQEISSLATSLPLSWNSSVFLRVDERRQDVLKAAIVGPEGTPYANGVFVFDIFLPPQYPDVPPKVQLLTTGGGFVRFNPNLYASGKVCLSLLGTWSGPGWRPGQSTLLQVLVSIQSLIFVEQPYFNEPGWEPQLGTPAGAAASERYNSEQRVNTLAVAILPALNNPPTHFCDVLAKHFKHKRAAIEAQCNAWCKALQQQRPDLPATVASIKQHLAKYA